MISCCRLDGVQVLGSMLSIIERGGVGMSPFLGGGIGDWSSWKVGSVIDEETPDS